MSASQTVSGRSTAKFRSSRFGATGRSWRLSVVRGGPRGPRRSFQPTSALHRPHPPPPPPPRGGGGAPPPRDGRGGRPRGAVGPAAGREEAADVAAQPGL